MAINVIDNFNYKGSKPLDARIKYDTVAAMASAAAVDLYDGCWAYVTATKKYYSYDSSNTTDPTTGKWREYSSGGGGTTVVANPEGEATDELEKLGVGNDIYSIPEENVEISKAQFDALPAETKNNGKAYYIPDANLVSNFTVMGNRFDKANIYDTTERMVGRWIDGKPLYQKTFYTTSSTTGSEVDISYNVNIDTVVNIEGLFHRTDNSTSRWLPMNCYTQSNMYGFICYDMSGKNIKYKLTGYSTDKQIITIQYTKTTDATVAIGTENDYSTDEMIIGTWIDGKPLYQKVITGLSVVLAWSSQKRGEGSMPAAISDISQFVDCIFYASNNGKYVGSIGESSGTWSLLSNDPITVTKMLLKYTKTTD